MRILLTIKYNGYSFFGWAKQPKKRTIQGELEIFFKTFYKRDIKVLGASRTDSKVHAKDQKAIIDLLSIEVANIKKLIKAFNKINNKLIYIKKIKLVDDDFTFKTRIKYRIYEYKIKLVKTNKNNVWDFLYPIDLKKMKSILKYFIGTHNFASFSAGTKYKSFVKHIEKLEFCKIHNTLIFFIKGHSFLRYQVRSIVGVLLAYARGKLTRENIIYLLKYPNQGANHYIAPGQGLTLRKLALH